jgi:hypothetical protein
VAGVIPFEDYKKFGMEILNSLPAQTEADRRQRLTVMVFLQSSIPEWFAEQFSVEEMRAELRKQGILK